MGSRAFWRGLLACALVVLAAALSLLPHVKSSAELVRMRNALVMDFDDSTRFDWTPADVPADFAVERQAPEPDFAERVQALHLERLDGDWERALALGRHLLEHRNLVIGGAIQRDLEQTYELIRSTGQGYCGDFADVYAAMALAAGLHVRSWAFSFDGFGGYGHIFNEVWDAQAGRWRMLDVFNNFYPVGADGRALSALEFRERLRLDGPPPRTVALEPAALPGFRDDFVVRDYFRRGLHQWYMWWGNALYTYDRALLVQLLGPVSRSLEQLGGIAQGVYPHIRVLTEEANAPQVAAMHRLKLHLQAVLGVSVAALLVALGLVAARLRARPTRRRSSRLA